MMMAEENNKSVVIWLPADQRYLILPDPAFWASLCLYHDKVVVCNWPLDTSRKVLEELANTTTGQGSLALCPEDTGNLKSAISFLEMLDVLSREGVVDAKMWEWGLHLMSTDGFKAVTRKDVEDIWDAHPQISPEHSVFALAISRERRYPLVINSGVAHERQDSQGTIEHLRNTLGTSAICQLSLPAIEAPHVDDLLEARTALKDELLEFRAGILNLTWLLYQQVQGKDSLNTIRQEANVLVNTKIKAAVMSLEHRMQQHKNKRIRRMLFRTGKVLVDAGTLSLASLGKALLTLAGEIDGIKPPEDQIATYLYKLKRQLKS